MPSLISSGSAPLRQAITGVPEAKDSIATKPKGSSQARGIRSAAALP
jgi:hypothetical protein